ncbi:DNA polymerase III subunit alpha [Sphingosinicellaceae bacterium]|nr:DNA polymerase III subunit alpha [Sphingosinicellaceae bacterium]
MSHAPFVHLRVQSAYSMLESACLPKDIAKACRTMGFAAVALGDRNNMFGAMEFSEACADAGVQPIVGALVAVERPGARSILSKPVTDWLVLLAQDAGGYSNLIALVSEAHLGSAGTDEPKLTLDAIAARSDGLLCLTAGAEGALARLISEGQDATEYADRLVAAFPERLYIEVSRTADPIEIKSEHVLVALAHDRDLPLVATNPVRFLTPDYHAAHDAMLCIADSAYVDAETRRRSNAEHWLKSPADMAMRFADLPEALSNTLVVARRCAVAAPARKPILPSLLAGDAEAEKLSLATDARAGLDARLDAAGVEDREAYIQRLNFECQVIQDMGFAAYFLIVADFIVWAKLQGIPVGPGRGSGAGSVVAWALTITDLDPIVHGLLFERFLNPDRVSMPDFDIDFCETRRDEVIQYVQARYGRDRVAQIITFGRLKARAVIKDVGRVLQMPYGQIDRLAKQVPSHPTDPWTLARTLGVGADKDGKKHEGIGELMAERRRDPKVERMFDIALKLEGLPRHASTHAAGVVIGDRPLAELVPMYRDPRSDMPVTQFDMKYVEKAGLVKFDFLGLKTLSVLDRAQKLLAARGVEVDWNALPLDDPAVYALLSRADTVGVFQFESEGMRRALTQVRPDCFADIVALGALYRPGPMENIPSFANRKHKREAIQLLHPAMEPVLAETYGIIVYQEQVMQIARTLAGYSLGEADLLRRAMGKKILAEMNAQKQRFAEGAAALDIPKQTATAIFDLVLKFANYGFNKSHAAAYAMLSYQTAWLKAHHPTEFFVASMAYDLTNTDRLAIFVDDARRSGVKVLPPCINASSEDFSVEATGDTLAVRYALAGLKGVGEKAMAAICAARAAGGKFTTLADFAHRIDPKLLNKRQLESLIAGGGFDGIAANRAGVHRLAEALLGTAQAAAAARESAQVALFGDAPERSTAMLVPPAVRWTLAEAMGFEKEAFGFYFSGHPADAFAHVLEANGAKTWAEVCGMSAPREGGRFGAVMAGLIEEMRWRTPQKGGDPYLLLTVSDSSGQFVASCFNAEAQALIESAVAAAQPVLLQVELQWRDSDESPRVAVAGLTPLAEMALRTRCRLTVDLGPGSIGALATALAPARGGRGEVLARIALSGGRIASLSLGRDFAIDNELKGRVGRLGGVERVALGAG